MNGRAFLTALLFGGAIAGTRLVAEAPALQPQKPEQRATATSPARCVARPANAAAISGSDSLDSQRSPRCSA